MKRTSRKARALCLSAEIHDTTRTIRRSWLSMARALHEFHEIEGWRHDGSGARSFRDWCADSTAPAYSTACQYMHVYRAYCLNGQVTPEELSGAPVRSLVAGLDVLRGGAEVEQIVADAVALPRPEFIATYKTRGARAVLREAVSGVETKAGAWDHSKAQEAAYAAVRDRPELHEELLRFAVGELVGARGRKQNSKGARLFQPTYTAKGRRINKPWTALTLLELRALAQAHRSHSENVAREARLCDRLFDRCLPELGSRDMRTTTVGEFLSAGDVTEMAVELRQETADMKAAA